MDISSAESTAHIALSLTTSAPTFSISGANDAANPFQLIVTARIVSSSRPESAITLQTDGTPLDHGRGLANAFFRGGFSCLADIADETRIITLKPPVRVNYGSTNERDLRKIGRIHVETVPASGELVIKHDLTAERMFMAHNHHGSPTLGPSDLKPGDKFRLGMLISNAKWWHFGSLDGELKDKKFVGSFEQPNEDGKYEYFDEIEGQKPDGDTLKRHGWMFTEKLENLKLTAEDGEDSVVIEFVAV